MSDPWDEWVPGVLNKSQMKKLLDGGFIRFGGSEPALDHSSLDVSLANEAYEMKHGSVKPSVTPYDWFITQKTKLAIQLTPGPDGIYELSKKKTYVFRLREKLGAGLREAGIYGQATAKSSIGRVDVLARLIVDGMNAYESFDPGGLGRGTGDMYLEITPITFNVKVKPGTSLSQLRFFYGDPNDVIIRAKELFNTIFPRSENHNESLAVDLSEATIGDPIRRAIDEHALPVEVVQNGQERLVFDPDPSRRWILLKLLDDDYLNSVMTHLRYEVNSKIARAIQGN